MIKQLRKVGNSNALILDEPDSGTPRVGGGRPGAADDSGW